MTPLEFLGSLIGLLFICVVVIWKVSRREMTEKEERAEGGNVVPMFPTDDDPEYSVGEDENFPTWKQVQNN